jgi:amino acid transporter
MTFIVFTYGYSSFKPWSLDDFWIYYTMLIAAPVLFVFWKVVKRTKFVRSSELDLVWEAPAIDMYERSFYEPPLGFWTEMMQLVGLRRNRGGDARRGSVAT